MATLASDPFTDTNGQPWSGTWAAGLTPTGGGATISSNAGLMTNGSAGGYAGADRVSRRVTITNPVDVVWQSRFQFVGETFPRIYLRSNGSAPTLLDTEKGYFIAINQGVGYGIGVTTGYSDTAISSTISMSITAGVWYWVIFGIVGTDLKAVIWPDGLPQPSWGIEASNGTNLTAGSFGITLASGNAPNTTFLIDDVTIFDTFPATPAAPQLVSRPKFSGPIPTRGQPSFWIPTQRVPPDVSTTTVTSDLDIRWAVTSTLNSDVDVRWKVANTLNSDLDLRWVANSFVNSDLDVRWKVANVFTSDLDLRWKVANALISDLDLKWAVRSVFTSDLDLRWAVRSVLTSNLDVRWKVANVLTSNLDLRWAVRSVLTSNLDLRWAVRSALNSDLDLRWRVYTLVNSNLDIRWIVVSSATTITSDLDLRWIARARISSDLNLRWIVVSFVVAPTTIWAGPGEDSGYLVTVGDSQVYVASGAASGMTVQTEPGETSHTVDGGTGITAVGG